MVLKSVIFKKLHTETLTPHISKCEFSQPRGTGVDATQTRKGVLI